MLSRNYTTDFACPDAIVKFQCRSESATFLQVIAEPVIPGRGADRVVFSAFFGPTKFQHGNIETFRIRITPFVVQMIVTPDENFINNTIKCRDDSLLNASFQYTTRQPGTV